MSNLTSKPIIGSLGDLEQRLGIKRGELRELLSRRSELYQPYDTPKKKHPYPGKKRLEKLAAGPTKMRHIDNPVKQLKDLQRKVLRRILNSVDLPDYMFGAVAGKALVDHATRHVKNQQTTVVRMDISAYYPSINCGHVYFVWNVVLGCPPPIAAILTQLTTFEFHLPQGAPTSPAIANILLASIYAQICLASEQKSLIISTWVDDLIFSGVEARAIMETVRSILAQHGLKDARQKREVLGPRAAKDITGARVGKLSARATHKKMSELRAAIYRLQIGSVAPQSKERYLLNLTSRIAHIRQIHEGDAKTLVQLAEKSGIKLVTPKSNKTSPAGAGQSLTVSSSTSAPAMRLSATPAGMPGDSEVLVS